MSDSRDSVPVRHRSLRLLCEIALAALLVGANLWLARSRAVPVVADGALRHALVLPSLLEFSIWVLASLALLIVAGLRHYPIRPGYLLLLSLPFIALGLAMLPVQDEIAPFWHLFLDLHLPLLLAIAALVAYDWGRALIPRRSGSRRTLAVGLVGVLAALALLSSPRFRFQSAVLGDEPKYLRFAENWYRGQGFDIEHFPDIRDLGPSFRPDLMGNVRRAIAALDVVRRDFAHDVREWLRHPTRGLAPRSQIGSNWFIPGRHGGVYQVHNPGFSVLLFPGYFIDRYFLNTTSEFHPQFPSDLYATNTTVLLLYLLWALALFDLLRVHTGENALSAGVAGVVMASLPAAAFNYQYYPEVAGGLLLTVLCRRLVVAAAPPPGMTTFLWGALAGCLPWLHVRFGLPMVIVAIVVGIDQRKNPAVLKWFGAGLVLPLAALAIYTYYLTGSLLPWALYGLVSDSSGFDASRAIREVWWYWLDRDWGLLAHAPVFILAAAGVVMCWRQQRRTMMTISALIIGLAFLSAAHGLTGGLTTPLRLIASVVPLLAVPLADAVRQFRRSQVFLALFAVLAVISIENAYSYNRYLVKHDAALAGPSASGWKSPLAFPSLADSGPRGWLLAGAWAAATLALVLSPRFVSTAGRPAARRRLSAAGVTAVTALAVACVSVVATAAAGERPRARYLVEPSAVRDRVVRAYLADKTTRIWSPEEGRIDVRATFASPSDATLEFKPPAASARPGAEIVLKAVAIGSHGELAWGQATIDYGDHTPFERIPFVGAEFVRHRYAAEGIYTLTVYLAAQEPASSIREAHATINIAAR